MRYTICGVPPALDAALRARARASGQTLNETVLQALIEGAGQTTARKKRRDLSDLVGTWKTDQEFDAAITAQDQVDEDLWK